MGSSAPNASSSSTMRGSDANALAMPTRWRWPPDRASGRRAGVVAGQTHQVQHLVNTLRAMRARSQPSRRGVMAMFSATLRCGNSPTAWNT